METLSLSGVVPQRFSGLATGGVIEAGQAVLLTAADLAGFDPYALAPAGALGLLVNAADAYEELPDDLERFSLINIHFDAFGDGRGFTLARRLRRDAGFSGELRASGPLMPDQTQYLARTGFDSLQLDDAKRIAAFKASLTRFSLFYQQAQDDGVSVSRLRHPVDRDRKAS